jgi:hypothetical protein
MRFQRFWASLSPLRQALVAAALLAAASAPAAASAKVIILGDSIGVGLSLAGGSDRLAHNSVAIRSADILNQLRRIDSSQVAVVSLGTNDAVGSIKGVDKAIDTIVDYVQRNNLRIVWMGPPCVLKTWNTNVVQLDRLLQDKLRRNAHITYVSVADDNFCDRSLRAADGVHFTMKGYGALWSRVKEKSGLRDERTAPARALQPAYTSASTKKKKKKYRAKIDTRGSA